MPLIGGLIAPNQGLFPKYDDGLYSEGNTNMIVSRGLGNSIIPFRFNNRPGSGSDRTQEPKLMLRAFLKERCNLNDERENAVFEELLYGVRSVAVKTADVLNHLEKLGVQLRSSTGCRAFHRLVQCIS